MLLRDTHHFVALLQEVQALATASGSTDSEEIVQRVIEHVDRIAAWGAARQRAWSDYYHRYLRDVVRLDPDRALSLRVRDQVAGWTARPFFLLVAHAPSIRLLRPLEARVERPAVTRPRVDREAPPAVVAPEDALGELEALVRAALADGAVDLADITARVLRALPAEVHYAAAGRVADVLARITRVRSEHERPWRPVVGRLELEDWTVLAEGDLA